MQTTENLTQEQYDKLKIFLISTCNIRFLPGEQSDMVESFEIIGKDEKIMGYFHKNQILELNQTGDSKVLYLKLVTEIKKINETKSEKNSSSFDDVDKLLNHISICDNCKSKLSEIIRHSNN